MEGSDTSLRYTICFIRHGDSVLLLRRKYPPLVGLLNGVGGKLEPGEAPLACALREIAEETGLCVDQIRFGGIVTWNGHAFEGTAGMYAYVAELPAGVDPQSITGEMDEGTLAWYPLSAVLQGLPDLVSNIPVFLTPMLAGVPPAEYRLTYDRDELLGCSRFPLSADID